MKDKTVSIILAKTEFELVKKINEDKRNFFATQPKEKKNGTWVCFCYSNKYSPEENTSSNSGDSNLATKKQLEYIYRNNIGVNTETLTKKEAIHIIGEHKKSNDKQNT